MCTTSLRILPPACNLQCPLYPVCSTIIIDGVISKPDILYSCPTYHKFYPMVTFWRPNFTVMVYRDFLTLTTESYLLQSPQLMLLEVLDTITTAKSSEELPVMVCFHSRVEYDGKINSFNHHPVRSLSSMA